MRPFLTAFAVVLGALSLGCDVDVHDDGKPDVNVNTPAPKSPDVNIITPKSPDVNVKVNP